MGRPVKRDLDEVLKAIRNSGGVQASVAQRLGVTRQTVASYLERWKTAADAMREEEMSVGDIGKSIIIGNMRAAYNLQIEAARSEDWQRAIVDTSDAKWWLKNKLSDEFSERQDVNLHVNLEELTDEELENLARKL